MTRAAAIVVVAAVAAVLLNVFLLARASGGNDPVGRLQPRVNVPAAPSWTVRPAHGTVHDEGSDD